MTERFSWDGHRNGARVCVSAGLDADRVYQHLLPRSALARCVGALATLFVEAVAAQGGVVIRAQAEDVLVNCGGCETNPGVKVPPRFCAHKFVVRFAKLGLMIVNDTHCALGAVVLRYVGMIFATPAQVAHFCGALHLAPFHETPPIAAQLAREVAPRASGRRYPAGIYLGQRGVKVLPGEGGGPDGQHRILGEIG